MKRSKGPSFAGWLTASKFMILSLASSLNWLSFCEQGVSRDSSQGWSILFTAKWLLLFSARPPFAVEPETGCNCNTTNPRWRTTVARAFQRQRWAWTKLFFWLMQLERRIFSICHMLRPIHRRLLLNQVHCVLLKMNSLATNICTVSLLAALRPDLDLNF